MGERIIVLTEPNDGKVEIGFEHSKQIFANVLSEYAQMLCDIYNSKLKRTF